MNFVRKLKELYNITSENSFFHSRLYEVGIVSRNFSLYFGISGIIARATGIMLDARITGYEYYNALDFILFFSILSDCWSRYFMRLIESLQASDIIFTLLSLILNSFIFNNSSSAAPRTSMESVISHFVYPSLMLNNFPSTSNIGLSSSTLQRYKGSRVFYGLYSSCKMSIESSKGIYSIFINSMLPFSPDRAFTVNIIANDFLAVTQLNKLCRTTNLPDLVAILGSVDFVLGSVDLWPSLVYSLFSSSNIFDNISRSLIFYFVWLERRNNFRIFSFDNISL